jgi:hypothetical protein
LFCKFFIFAIVNIKNIGVVSYNMHILIRILTHKHLRPQNKKYRLFSIFPILILLSEFFHIRIENEFNTVGSLKTSIKHFQTKFLCLNTICLFEFLFELL